jgi:hypothetical protein
MKASRAKAPNGEEAFGPASRSLKPAWQWRILGVVTPLLDVENPTMHAARLVAPVALLALVAGCGTNSTPETTKPAPEPQAAKPQVDKPQPAPQPAPTPANESPPKAPDSASPKPAPSSPAVRTFGFGEQVPFGDLLVSIREVRSGQAGGQYLGSYRSVQLMWVVIEVKNTSKGKIVEWPGWQRKAQIEDEHGNKFGPVSLTGWSGLPDNDTINGGWRGDFGARVHPGTTYVEALYYEYAPPTTRRVVIEVPLGQETIRFSGPIGSKKEFDHAKALARKAGVILDAADLIKRLREGSKDVETAYPIGCSMKATGVVRNKNDETQNRSDIKGPLYMIQISYQPEKPINTDESAICYTTDKGLFDSLNIGETVTLQGKLKFIPQRRDGASQIQAHLENCVEVDPQGRKVSAEEKARKVAEKARQQREEAKAKALLRSGLQLADKGFKPQARKRYQEVIDKFPGTDAAAKAKKLLEEK